MGRGLGDIVRPDVRFHRPGAGRRRQPPAADVRILLGAERTLRNRVPQLGGAVAAVAAVAGVEHEATTTDVAIVQFERACAKHGLSTRSHPVPDAAADRVARQLDPWTRFQWWLSGAWEGFVLYEISTQKGSS